MKKLRTALNACEMSDEEQDNEHEQDQEQQQQQQIAKHTTTTTTTATKATTAVTSSTTKDPTAISRVTRATTLSTVDEKPDSKLVRQRVALQQQRQQQQQQHQQMQLESQVSKSQSLSSSSTVKDSLDGGVVEVEETSLVDATASAPAATLPSSCSTGAIPRISRPGISTGATPKTTTTTPTISTRLPTSQSHPTSYDLPPALPHTYSATATVRGPLGMSMSSSAYTMPASARIGTSSGLGSGSAGAGTAAGTQPPTTTTISLLPLPAPPTMATAPVASIPGQVLESSGATSLSLSLMQPMSAMRPATASGLTTSSFTTTSSALEPHRSHPSSAGSVMGRGSLLLAPPKSAAGSATGTVTSSSKFEPELVLSPAKLGQ